MYARVVVAMSVRVAVLVALLAASAHAASFDCRKASTTVEVRVCADTELSKLDEDLAAAYKTALAGAPDPQLVKREQRQWSQLRNGCDDRQQKCLGRLYQERVAELRGSMETSVFHFRGFSADSGSGSRRRKQAWTYGSPTAQALWVFVSDQIGSGKDAKYSEVQRERAMYARVGPESFLIMMGGIYLAQPTHGRLELLVSARLDDDWELPEFRPLPGNQTWVFLRANHLSQGIHTEYYGALFVKPSLGKEPTVTLVDIASFSDIDDELCEENGRDNEGASQAQILSTAQHVDSVDVTDVNHDSRDDIILRVSEQDCQTRDTTARRHIFVNTGTGFRKLSESESESERAGR